MRLARRASFLARSLAAVDSQSQSLFVNATFTGDSSNGRTMASTVDGLCRFWRENSSAATSEIRVRVTIARNGRDDAMLVCYPYTPANRSDVLALARTHFMYLASAINHTDAHTSSAVGHKSTRVLDLGGGDAVDPSNVKT